MQKQIDTIVFFEKKAFEIHVCSTRKNNNEKHPRVRKFQTDKPTNQPTMQQIFLCAKIGNCFLFLYTQLDLRQMNGHKNTNGNNICTQFFLLSTYGS